MPFSGFSAHLPQTLQWQIWTTLCKICRWLPEDVRVWKAEYKHTSLPFRNSQDSCHSHLYFLWSKISNTISPSNTTLFMTASILFSVPMATLHGNINTDCCYLTFFFIKCLNSFYFWIDFWVVKTFYPVKKPHSHLLWLKWQGVLLMGAERKSALAFRRVDNSGKCVVQLFIFLWGTVWKNRWFSSTFLYPALNCRFDIILHWMMVNKLWQDIKIPWVWLGYPDKEI